MDSSSTSCCWLRQFAADICVSVIGRRPNHVVLVGVIRYLIHIVDDTKAFPLCAYYYPGM